MSKLHVVNTIHSDIGVTIICTLPTMGGEDMIIVSYKMVGIKKVAAQVHYPIANSELDHPFGSTHIERWINKYFEKVETMSVEDWINDFWLSEGQ